jgi:hypothetical protein
LYKGLLAADSQSTIQKLKIEQLQFSKDRQNTKAQLFSSVIKEREKSKKQIFYSRLFARSLWNNPAWFDDIKKSRKFSPAQ